MAKKIFLGKVHQYIKDRVLETKYACSFLFDITGSNVLVSEEVCYLPLLKTHIYDVYELRMLLI